MVDHQASLRRNLPPHTQNTSCDFSTSSHGGTAETGQCKDVRQHPNKTASANSSPERSKFVSQPVSVDDLGKENEYCRKSKDLQDAHLFSMPSRQFTDDDPAPLSIKNFLKVVRTFSKRRTKSPKRRPEPISNATDTDVVVFERPATPRADCAAGSGPLAPILDFADILTSNGSFDEAGLQEEVEIKSDMLRRVGQAARKGRKEEDLAKQQELQADSTSEATEKEQNVSVGLGDALQEFGSSDSSAQSEPRISRKSLRTLDKPIDDQETLLF